MCRGDSCAPCSNRSQGSDSVLGRASEARALVRPPCRRLAGTGNIYQLLSAHLGTSIPIKDPRFPVNEHQFLSPDARLICRLPAGSKMARGQQARLCGRNCYRCKGKADLARPLPGAVWFQLPRLSGGARRAQEEGGCGGAEGQGASLGGLRVSWPAAVLGKVLAWALGGPARSTQRWRSAGVKEWTWSHTVGWTLAAAVPSPDLSGPQWAADPGGSLPGPVPAQAGCLP